MSSGVTGNVMGGRNQQSGRIINKRHTSVISNVESNKITNRWSNSYAQNSLALFSLSYWSSLPCCLLFLVLFID